MQLFASCNILVLAALLGATMVSAQPFAVSNAYAKPLVVKSGGFLTATFDLAIFNSRRRLQEARGFTSRELGSTSACPNKTICGEASFFINSFPEEETSEFRLQAKEDKEKEEKNKEDTEKKEKKPGCSAKSTDDLQFKSAKMWPNVKPKVKYEVSTIEGNALTPDRTVVTWEIPTDDIVEDKKYTFAIKLKVGPNADGWYWVTWDFPQLAWDNFGSSDFYVK